MLCKLGLHLGHPAVLHSAAEQWQVHICQLSGISMQRVTKSTKRNSGALIPHTCTGQISQQIPVGCPCAAFARSGHQFACTAPCAACSGRSSGSHSPTLCLWAHPFRPAAVPCPAGSRRRDTSGSNCLAPPQACTSVIDHQVVRH